MLWGPTGPRRMVISKNSGSKGFSYQPATARIVGLAGPAANLERTYLSTDRAGAGLSVKGPQGKSYPSLSWIRHRFDGDAGPDRLVVTRYLASRSGAKNVEKDQIKGHGT